MTNPRMVTITLTTKNTPYKLSALLNAVDSALGVNPYKEAQYLAIQANPNGGGAKYYIGNSDLTAANCGVLFYASQTVPYPAPSGMDVIDTASIWVMSNTDAQTMNVQILFR